MDTGTVTIDGLDVRYRALNDTGETALILLHGWGQSVASWVDFPSRIDSRFRIIALDLPGFGLSDEPPAVWSVRDYADFVHRFLQKLKIQRPVVMGHSFGGRIAIAYAAQYPTQGLVVYSSNGGLPDTRWWKRVSVRLASLMKYVAPNLFYMLHTTVGKPASYDNETRILTGRSRRMLDIYTMPPTDLTRDMKHIATPTLILSGQKDWITPAALGKAISVLIPYSTYVELPGAGHFGHIQAGKEFVNVVNDFLKKI